MRRAPPAPVLAWVLLAGILLAGVLAAPAASAQAGMFVDVDISLDAESVTLGRGAERGFTATVRNPTQNPIPANVSLELGALQSGWTVTGLEPRSFDLAGGESREVAFTLRIGEQAAAGTYPLNLTATARSLLDPGGQFPATDSAEAEVQVRITSLQDLDDRLSGNLLFMAILAVLLVAVMILAAVLRRRPARLAAVDARQQVPPGGVARFRIRLRNPDRRGHEFVLRSIGGPSGWSSRVEPSRAVVSAGKETVVHLGAQAPATASGEARFRVIAERGGRPVDSVEVVAEVVEAGGAPDGPRPGAQGGGGPGQGPAEGAEEGPGGLVEFTETPKAPAGKPKK